MTKRFIAWLVIGVALTQEAAQAGVKRSFILSEQQVDQVIEENFIARGRNLIGVHVLLPANIFTAIPYPVVDVSSVDSLPEIKGDGGGETRFAVRMVCRQMGTCLPFYAIVSWPVGKRGQELQPPAHAEPATYSQNNVMMRIGTYAKLLLDDGSMHIQIAVICLENGAAGKRIRVTTPDHRQAYVAQVISADLLRGSF
jgi:hypothetical protein